MSLISKLFAPDSIITGPDQHRPEWLRSSLALTLGYSIERQTNGDGSPGSVSAKRSLALREFALGIEVLERFVRQEPLRRVHECVFGVLALESEPVDPRL